MSNRICVLSIVCVAGMAVAASGQEAEFHGLGFLDLVNPDSTAADVTADGTVVVGWSTITGLEFDGKHFCDDGECVEFGNSRGFRWSIGDGITPLEGPDGMMPCCDYSPRAGQALGVSRNGDYAGGYAEGVEEKIGNSKKFAVRWAAGATTPEHLGTLEPGERAQIEALSDGGIVAVGHAVMDETLKPVISTFGGQVQNLIPNAPPGTSGYCLDVSADGTIILGSVTIAGESAEAVRWTLDGGTYTYEAIDPGAGLTCLSMSADGSTIVGYFINVDHHLPFRFTDGKGVEILDLPDGATTGFAYDLSDDGEIVVGEFDIWAGPAIWDEEHGWRELEQVLEDLEVLTPGWTLVDAPAISGDGSTIVGTGVDPQGFLQAYRAVIPRPKDTDGDGLLDSWEIDGIPYETENGEVLHYLIDVDGDGVSDADPMRKDLFVEIDHMASLTFPEASIDELCFAFAASPVPNPDGFDGISLYIVVDDGLIPFEEVTEVPENDFPENMDTWKEALFGTQEERSDPNAAALLEAKAKAYRYCLFLNTASTGIGGMAEQGGDDMVLFVGELDPLDKASVFMHELGHNLGLSHGGSDDVNGKPNYPSIMNYVLAFREPWSVGFWKLDYSREELAPLDESFLNETIGVGVGGSGFYDDFYMPFYAVVPEDAACYPEDEWGTPQVLYASLMPASSGQDYNADCDELDTFIPGDLNYLEGSALPGALEPSPDELLVGHNDWANIVLAVSSTGGAFAGPTPQDEVTEEQRAYMAEHFPPPPSPCLADCNKDDQLNILDFVCYQNLFQSGDLIADCTGDGQLNILDFVCFQGAFEAGCP